MSDIKAVFTKTFLLGAVILAALLATEGCTKKGKDVTVEVAGQKLTLPYKDTLRIRIVSEPPSLDWHKATDTTSSEVINNIMDGLAGYDYSKPEPEVIPLLASKWTTKDNKTWVITLREDVKWTDGQPLTPQNVIDGWQRLLEPATAGEYAYFLFPLKNGQAFNSGKLKDFSQVGVKASGPHEVTVELERPMSFFPMLLTHSSTYPVRLDIVKKYGDKWTEPGNIVTIGPFNLKLWEHDKQMVLERNEGYYGTKPKIKYVLGHMIQEVSTALNLFEAGKIDFVDEVPAQQIRQWKGKKEYKSIGQLVIQYYGFNVEKAPVNNVKVRQAIAHAIDRQEIANVLSAGEIPMTSFVPTGMFGYEADRGLPFNIEKAKQLLKEAGYGEGGKPFPKLEFRMNTNENHQIIAENVQAQLKRNLGIDMEIKNEEWKVYLKSLQNDTPAMWRMGWNGDYPDPDNFLNLFTSYSENNRTHWKSKEYDAIIEKAASEADRDKRRQLYIDAQKMLLEDVTALVPLVSSVSKYLVAERIENFPVNVLGNKRFDQVSIK
jgi:oligopeptide transport system substrate-binding protein